MQSDSQSIRAIFCKVSFWLAIVCALGLVSGLLVESFARQLIFDSYIGTLSGWGLIFAIVCAATKTEHVKLRLRFSIRDLLWLTILVALAVHWSVERTRLEREYAEKVKAMEAKEAVNAVMVDAAWTIVTRDRKEHQSYLDQMLEDQATAQAASQLQSRP